MGEDILTILEYVQCLKVTEETVYDLDQKRKIPFFKVGDKWRFRREELAACIEQ